MQITKESDELCPYWEDKEFREPYIAIIPPQKDSDEWRCKIECSPVMNSENYRKSFIAKCDKCSNLFPILEQKLLSEFLNAFEPKADPILPRSNEEI